MALLERLQEIIGEKIFRHAVQLDKTLEVRGRATFKGLADLQPYDTGWINRSDWTNVHLGSDTTKDTNSNVTHNLNVPLSKLLVKVLVSTDGTDANSWELPQGVPNSNYGITVFGVDNNNIKVQTGASGCQWLSDDGVKQDLAAQDYYYKVKVWYIG